MPECAKTHLQQSRISKFSGGGPPDPPLQGEGREGRRGRGKGREGRGGKEGRNGGSGGDGRGARHGLRPPRDKLWIRPWADPQTNTQTGAITINCAAASLARCSKWLFQQRLVEWRDSWRSGDCWRQTIPCLSGSDRERSVAQAQPSSRWHDER